MIISQQAHDVETTSYQRGVASALNVTSFRRHVPSGIEHFLDIAQQVYYAVSMSMRRHYVAPTLIRRCLSFWSALEHNIIA